MITQYRNSSLAPFITCILDIVLNLPILKELIILVYYTQGILECSFFKSGGVHDRLHICPLCGISLFYFPGPLGRQSCALTTMHSIYAYSTVNTLQPSIFFHIASGDIRILTLTVFVCPVTISLLVTIIALTIYVFVRPWFSRQDFAGLLTRSLLEVNLQALVVPVLLTSLSGLGLGVYGVLVVLCRFIHSHYSAIFRNSRLF